MGIPPLTMSNRKPDRLEMIEQALKDQAPKLYRELARKGTLEAFKEDRDNLIMEAYEELIYRATDQKLGPKSNRQNPMERQQAFDMALLEGWKEILDNSLEFQNGETTELPMESWTEAEDGAQRQTPTSMP